MAKGKKKTQTVQFKKEAKENLDQKLTCKEQLTSSLCNPRPQLCHSPLFPIQEENSPRSVADASKCEVRLKTDVHSPERENKTQSSLPGPKEKPANEVRSSSAVPTSKPEQAKIKVNKQKPKAERKNLQQNRKVTDYYPIRRSSRKSKVELECEEQRHLDDLILNDVEDGLKVRYIEGKGRGVFADKAFQKGQFVVEYHGDLLQITDAKKREVEYAQDPTKGCYMYYFHHHNTTYCIDATKETDRLGRLINHSKNGNCQTRLHNIKGVPHLILVASRDIKAEEELLYDYGDRSKEAIAAHPWLKL
ncbi:lysine methyltransferase 5Ab [Trichomycterus rosablanca]|uniref:lysine methyltransferase 5Ab n=1 Tax=Trichomycterus rosablanca TaxID=2290929 RepID=UPI002F35A7B7